CTTTRRWPPIRTPASFQCATPAFSGCEPSRSYFLRSCGSPVAQAARPSEVPVATELEEPEAALGGVLGEARAPAAASAASEAEGRAKGGPVPPTLLGLARPTT